MERAEQAVDLLIRGFNCSQSVLSVFAPEFGLDRDTALRIGCGFGGGMGRMQDTCGAVTGAYMVIGLKHGKDKEGDDQKKEKTYALVNEFDAEFRKKFGTTVCRELLQCELNGDEWKTLYLSRNLHRDVCARCVKEAVEILEGILNSSR